MDWQRVIATVAFGLIIAGADAEPGRGRRFLATSNLNRAALEHDGLERGFGWYTGTGVGEAPAPVVFVLHGGGGSAARIWSGDDGRAWRRLADEHGLVLLLPEGRTDPGNPDAHHWNDCRSNVLEPDAASHADDVGFLAAAVDWAAARWPLDLDRVYVTGASNGGMMAYRTAMNAPNLVAAAAAVIANLPDPSECPGPFRAMPVLIMNGTADPLMPWDGGCVGLAGCVRGTVLSTEDTVAFWVGEDRADPEPVCIDLPDIVPDDDSTVTVCTYGGGVAGSEVMLYRINGGGHAPPGPDALPFWYSLIVGPKNHDISAPDEIWDFFQRHRRITPHPLHPSGRVR